MPRRPAGTAAPSRTTARLSRESIVASGIELADRAGLDGLSMRRLGQELGVDPMSVYHHLKDKNALLDAMIDAVVAEIEALPTAPGTPGRGAAPPAAWTGELRALVLGARRTMLRHPWAVQVLAQRADPTPATLRHLDQVLGILRRGGCSVELGHHALHLLGSRLLGFSQDLFDDSASRGTATTAAQLEAWAGAYPHVVELATAAAHEGGLGGCDDDAEFAFALDLLLDGLERRRQEESSPTARGPAHRLATYGTLAPGRANHHQLDGLVGHWFTGHVHGTLVHEGWGATLGYPAIVPDPDGPAVPVHVFDSADLPAHWARLDDFEGPAYERAVVDVFTSAGVVQASIYALAPRRPD